jgi:hypothetical protein
VRVPFRLAAPALVALLAPAQDSRPALPHGHIVVQDGLRIVHLYGNCRQRGDAHGRLLGLDIARLVRAEWEVRFARAERLLEGLRARIDRAIDLPPGLAGELEAMLAAMQATGVDLRLPSFERDLDLADLKVVAALDVFARIGCSGFTLGGDAVLGGGVLTARNFDWPLSGPHLVQDVIVLVQHPDDGAAFACVTWPGYLGAVTAVSERGLATFLHVGNGRLEPAPRPRSWPTALAAREILRAAHAQDAVAVAQRLLERSSPPASYVARVVLPVADAPHPEIAFEIDGQKALAHAGGALCVVTNHFQGRRDAREPAFDSRQRHAQLCESIARLCADGDQKVSTDEAWQALRKVQRGGGAAFGTLHSLVFRHQPWFCELRVGELGPEGRLRAAPSATRRFVLARETLFPAPR